VLVCGTFRVTQVLTQRMARTLEPHQGPRMTEALIEL